MPLDLIITAAAVVTMDGAGTVFAPGAVAVEGERIAGVGPADEARHWSAPHRWERPDAVVLPGFVDAHDHLFQSLARHRGDGLGLYDWLRTCMWPYADSLSVDDAVAATRFAACELVHTGVTTVLDHAYAPVDPAATRAVADAIEGIGLRGFVARGVYGTPLTPNPARRPSPLDTAPELAVLRALMAERAGRRVQVVPGPTNAATVEAAVLTGAAALAREFAVPWQTHCCEVAADAETIRSREGRAAIGWLDHLGVLDRHATLAHAIWLDESEVALLGQRGAAAVHNPQANLRCGSGVIPLTALRAAGVRVGLGVDGSAGHHADVFSAMRAAIGLQRLAHGPGAMTPTDALAMATRDGAAALGIDAGTLETGRLADLAVVRLPPLADGDVVSRLVWGAGPPSVSDVVVGGRPVMTAGVCHTMDAGAVIAAADAAARRVWSR